MARDHRTCQISGRAGPLRPAISARPHPGRPQYGGSCSCAGEKERAGSAQQTLARARLQHGVARTSSLALLGGRPFQQGWPVRDQSAVSHAAQPTGAARGCRIGQPSVQISRSHLPNRNCDGPVGTLSRRRRELPHARSAAAFSSSPTSSSNIRMCRQCLQKASEPPRGGLPASSP